MNYYTAASFVFSHSSGVYDFYFVLALSGPPSFLSFPSISDSYLQERKKPCFFFSQSTYLCERMNRKYLRIERFIDEPMSHEFVLALEQRRHDQDFKGLTTTA